MAFAKRQSLLAASAPSIFLFLLHGAAADTLEKVNPGGQAPVHEAAFQMRAKLYERLLREALAVQPVTVPIVLAIDLCDSADNDFDIPVFSFQKRRGVRTPLLPDMEMVSFDYYEGVEDDVIPFEAKQTRAVFAGSTTGGQIITLDMARAAGFPRLRAAEYFRGSAGVDFSLGNLVQCETAEVEAYLRTRGHGARTMGWPETYEAKFGISIDGNGAACSRPAILLRSNCVLLKYASEFVLYHSSALVAGTHYLEIDEDVDVLRVVAAEGAEPGRYAAVAANGRALARDLLNRDAVLAYTSALIAGYAAIVP